MIIVLSLDVAKRFNNPLKDLENLVKFYEYNLTYSMDTKLEKIFYRLNNRTHLENFNFKKIEEIKDVIRDLRKHKDYQDFIRSEIDYGVPNYIKEGS